MYIEFICVTLLIYMTYNQNKTLLAIFTVDKIMINIWSPGLSSYMYLTQLNYVTDMDFDGYST